MSTLQINLAPVVFILKESHSSVEFEGRWTDELNGNLHFYHEKTNCCWVTITFRNVITF